MLIGLPRETKPAEARVALTPASVDSLIHDMRTATVRKPSTTMPCFIAYGCADPPAAE